MCNFGCGKIKSGMQAKSWLQGTSAACCAVLSIEAALQKPDLLGAGLCQPNSKLDVLWRHCRRLGVLLVAPSVPLFWSRDRRGRHIALLLLCSRSGSRPPCCGRAEDAFSGQVL
jgi:hypothetical protein